TESHSYLESGQVVFEGVGMSRAVEVAKVADREKTAERLLRSSADKYYDPDVDIDWAAPFVAGKYFQPEHRVSLYNTYLWDRLTHALGRLLPVIGYGPALYGSVLIVEELLDRLQREAMADENVQPMIRMVNRIHVLEEARHVTFARQEVVAGMPGLSRAELYY